MLQGTEAPLLIQSMMRLECVLVALLWVFGPLSTSDEGVFFHLPCLSAPIFCLEFVQLFRFTLLKLILQ